MFSSAQEWQESNPTILNVGSECKMNKEKRKKSLNKRQLFYFKD